MLWIIAQFALERVGRLPLEKSGRTYVNVDVKIDESPQWYALQHANDPEYWRHARPDRIVISLKKGLNLNSKGVKSLLQKYGVEKVVAQSMFPEMINFYVVELPGGNPQKALSFIRDAKEIPEIVFAEPEIIHYTMGCPPNDTYWGYQWGPYVIWADSAWCYETGDTAIVVAVIDQGVDYSHEDLGNVQYGYDYVDNDPNPAPDNPYNEHHGTHVSGTVAATLNNSRGIAGMGNVFIYAARALDETGSGTSAWIANAILGSSTYSRVRVINMSLGSPSPSSLIQAACDTAWNRGKLLIAASGNDGSYGISYPAAFPSVIAVGSIGTDGYSFYLAPYSNYGPEQELTAPGGDNNTGYCILSTLPMNNYGDIGSGCSWVGTSMAAPHASGVAALVFSRRPSLTNSAVRSILTSTAIDLGDPGWDMYYGYGVVCAICAVLAVSVNEAFNNNTLLPYKLQGLTLEAFEPLTVYSISGRLIAKLGKGENITLKKGVYFVKDDKNIQKVVVF